MIIGIDLAREKDKTIIAIYKGNELMGFYEDEDPYANCENEVVDITGIEATTKDAILFKSKKGNFWLPKSQIISKGEDFVEYPDFVTLKYIISKANAGFKDYG